VDQDGIKGDGGSSVRTANILRAGRPRFDSRQGLQLFLLATASKPPLGPSQPPIQRVMGLFPPGAKLITHIQLVQRVRMRGFISPLPQYVFMTWCLTKQWIRLHGVVLIKYRDNFNFTLPLSHPSLFHSTILHLHFLPFCFLSFFQFLFSSAPSLSLFISFPVFISCYTFPFLFPFLLFIYFFPSLFLPVMNVSAMIN
jgi:hypothetical protein